MGEKFGRLLGRHLEERGQGQADLNREIGIPKSTLSDIVNGNIDPPRDWLIRIIQRFSGEPRTQSELVCAYLLDNLPGELRGMVDIRNWINGSKSEPFKPPLNEFEAALRDIARCNEPAVRDALIALAKMVPLVEARQRAK